MSDSPEVEVVLIAAVSTDGFISRGSGVPWDLPADRAHFRQMTNGKWLLFGRSTFDEMQGWFHNHHPLVLTHRSLPEAWDGCAVSGVAEAIDRVRRAGGTELWVCGGASVYELALPLAKKMVLTRVDDVLTHGVSFPPFSAKEWQMERCESRAADVTQAKSLEWQWWAKRPDCD